MGRLGTFLVVISGVITIIIGLIFIEGTVRLYRSWPLKSYCIAVATIAVFPIASLCFLLSILMPRAHDVNTTTATLYQPLSLVLFYKLVISYFGREEALKQTLDGQLMPLKGPPFYALCICLPTTYMNTKLYYLMKACIYQLFMAPCFLYFAMGVASKTGVYVAGQFSFENAAIYILVLGGLSFCIGIYSLEIYYKMTQTLLPGFYIRSKYYILQMYFVITRFHVLIFDALGTNGYLPCRPPISSFVYGLYLRNSLLLFESLLLALLARYIFLRLAPNRRLDNYCESMADSIT
ncbi:unnamed protein product [Oppiella nova]|uniref:Uncharacterized protein n=1 Tax=Oppiella nova TaxID=334625 RepID=A0A7R9QQ24_9ACAR|nr:unnamed protein product [Oppiella nova]CAG2171441.1 unnamed protein product [Oppiella nova]